MPTYRIEGQIYEAETPDEAYAKHNQATKGAPAAPRAEKGMGTGQMLAQAMVNFPRSAYELGKSTFEAVTSPIETGKAVVDLGNSVLGKMGVTDASPEMADRVGKFYTNRYGGVENAKETFATDPAGFLADAATILTGGGAAVRQIPGAAKVGKAVERAGAAIDPLNVATKAVKGGGKAAAVGLGFTTGAGTRAVEEAAKAGYRGGEQGQAFVGQMRGTAPVTDVVETIGDTFFHKEDAGLRQIIDIEEFPHRLAAAPHHVFAVTALLRFVRLADQRRQHVAGGEVVVVVGAVEIGWHYADVARAVLAVAAFTKLDAGNLGDGVGFVGLLQRTGEQIILPDRLRTVAGIDATGAKKA